MSAPIMVRCEGSGLLPHRMTGYVPNTCQMCGRPRLLVDGMLVEHERLDVLAMIERGDYDADDTGGAS